MIKVTDPESHFLFFFFFFHSFFLLQMSSLLQESLTAAFAQNSSNLQ